LSSTGVVTSAQPRAPFTAEDLLDVVTASVLDLTEDGARVAVALRRLRDNAVTDHRRFDDPTKADGRPETTPQP
jgi:hypothetical protein